MTNINEVMDRLEGSLTRVTDWKSVSDDLKALLSYTKQCREKMDLALSLLEEGFSPSGGMYVDGGAKLVAARQALSTQPGERE